MTVTALHRFVVCDVCTRSVPAHDRDPEKLEIVCHKGGTRAEAVDALAKIPAPHFAPCERACVNAWDLPEGADPKRLHAGKDCRACAKLQEAS